MRSINTGLFALFLASLAGCSPDYSPNTYSASAVQQASKVERGLVVGYREVQISANGTVGAVSGGAAGGILGAQFGSSPTDAALGGVAGTAVGGLLGTAIEHASGDTTGWEYIVKKPNGEMISVTQKEPQPLPIGQKVLVIAGTQARIIPDYSVEVPHAEAPAKAEPAPTPAPPVAIQQTQPTPAPVPAAEDPAAQARPAQSPAPAPVPAATPDDQTPKAVTSTPPEQAAPAKDEAAPPPAPESAAPAKEQDPAPAKEQDPVPAKAEDPAPARAEPAPAAGLGGFDFSTPGARLQILERIQAPGGTGSGE